MPKEETLILCVVINITSASSIMLQYLNREYQPFCNRFWICLFILFRNVEVWRRDEQQTYAFCEKVFIFETIKYTKNLFKNFQTSFRPSSRNDSFFLGFRMDSKNLSKTLLSFLPGESLEGERHPTHTLFMCRIKSISTFRDSVRMTNLL